MRYFIFLLIAIGSSFLFVSSSSSNSEDPTPQYLTAVVKPNALGTKCFVEIRDGENPLIEVVDENGKKVDFGFSKTKVLNYMHQKGYRYVEEYQSLSGEETAFPKMKLYLFEKIE